MAAKVIKNEFYPESTITLALFKNVENAKQVRQCVMSGEFEASLLKTSMVSSGKKLSFLTFKCCVYPI